MESTAFTNIDMVYIVISHETWSQQQLLENGVLKIYSEEMQSTAFTEYTTFTYKRSSIRYLLFRDGFHINYSSEMEYTEFIDDKWSPLHLLIRNGVHASYTFEILYTTFNLERWSPQYFLIRDGVHSLYS